MGVIFLLCLLYYISKASFIMECVAFFIIYCHCATGPMYFVFCRLYPSSHTHQPPRQCLAPSCHLSHSITGEGLHNHMIEEVSWDPKEDKRGPLSVLFVYVTARIWKTARFFTYNVHRKVCKYFNFYLSFISSHILIHKIVYFIL